MDEIRKKIQETDDKLIQLISQRLELAKKLGELKKERKLPIEDKQREEYLFSYWSELAKKNNLPPEFIKKLWTLILKESIRIQE